jgi:D-glycero-D-manno-heptose 1,7-bisphosphate phosphatase
MTLRRAAFLDRDGVINIDRGYVYRPEEFEFVDGVFEGTSTLQRLGLALVIISNQSGIGRGLYSEADLDVLNRWMQRQFEQRAIRIEGVFHCPHHPTEAIGHYRLACDCRKPAPGMLFRAARELNLDLQRSVLFGDRASDLQAAANAGVPLRYLLGTDGLSRPAPAEPPGLSTAQFINLKEAAASLEVADAVSALARAE